jgi:hypothetical protein
LSRRVNLPGAVITAEEAVSWLLRKIASGSVWRLAQKGDQYNVRYTMLDVQLKEKGIRWTVHRKKGTS